MSAQPHYSHNQMSETDYLELERTSDTKHEFYNGEVVAMAGASRRHNAISMAISSSLYTQVVDRPCEVYQGDMRVKAERLKSYTYPDVVVVCGEPILEEDIFDTLLNPTLLVEVLSPGTEKDDRGKKFRAYRDIASFKEYLIVSQDSSHIEHYRRQADGTWLLIDAIGLGATITLSSIDCLLALADVYRKVTFDSDEET